MIVVVLAKRRHFAYLFIIYILLFRLCRFLFSWMHVFDTHIYVYLRQRRTHFLTNFLFSATFCCILPLAKPVPLDVYYIHSLQATSSRRCLQSPRTTSTLYQSPIPRMSMSTTPLSLRRADCIRSANQATSKQSPLWQNRLKKTKRLFLCSYWRSITATAVLMYITVVLLGSYC